MDRVRTRHTYRGLALALIRPLSARRGRHDLRLTCQRMARRDAVSLAVVSLTVVRLAVVRLAVVGLAVVGLAVVGLASGCNARPATKTVPVAPKDETAEGILQQMTDAYSAADSYRDRGIITLSYRQQGEQFGDQAPLEVRFERPNRVFLRAYQATVASDGAQLRATIQDPRTEDLHGQVLVAPAPAVLSLKALYADQVLDDVLQSGLGRYPVQLELLLSDQPLQAFRDPKAKRQLLEPATIERHACYRVAIETEEGRFVLWVDRESWLLRRMEYPAGVLNESLAAGDQVNNVSLVADFLDAEFDVKFQPDDFQLALPPDARQVQALVLPPEPLPTGLYGRRPERFFFTDLNGQQVSQQDMVGKTTVLVWFTGHPACQPALEQLDRVRRQLTESREVQFFAVCTEPSTMSNERLRDLLRQWQVELPLLRDLEAFGRDVFQIPGAPTMVVLNPQGAVQVFEAGASAELMEQLPELLRRLDQGQDLARQVLDAYQVEQENYRRLLESGGTNESTVLDVPETPIRPASQPQQLQLRELWSCDQLRAAGNLLVVPATDTGEDAPKILAFDGFQTVVELSADGEVLQRHPLELPPNSATTYLRTALDGAGNRFYAAASLRGPQVHLFDQNWKPVGNYPALDQQHEGVHDARLADLDADGKLELYAGFWGLVGIHAVDLQGQKLWSNRAATNVLTLAVTPTNPAGWRKLLASSDLGPITRINQFGHDDKPIEVANRAIHHIYGWEGAADGLPPYCGLSYQGTGQMVAVGLDDGFAEQWAYTLPAGSYATELQFVTSMTLPDDQRAWALAGPDGSVHLVRADGQFSDNFGTGAALTGIAGFVGQGRSILLLATAQRITAWELALPVKESP